MHSGEKKGEHISSGSIEIYFLGSLAKKRGAAEGLPLWQELEGPKPLREVLALLPLNPDDVQMVMVNHRAVTPDHMVKPGDRLALFPKEYPLFADWSDFRSVE